MLSFLFRESACNHIFNSSGKSHELRASVLILMSYIINPASRNPRKIPAFIENTANINITCNFSGKYPQVFLFFLLGLPFCRAECVRSSWCCWVVEGVPGWAPPPRRHYCCPSHFHSHCYSHCCLNHPPRLLADNDKRISLKEDK